MKQPFRLLFVLGLALSTLQLTGCAQNGYARGGHNTPKSVGTYKVGKPYKVASVWHYPRESYNLVETGTASWYGPNFHGKLTANGETYNQNAMTAAHRTLQMPSVVRVTNLENRRSVIVRVNDRGPFKSGRIIDLSKAAAQELDMIKSGTAKVRVEVLEKESHHLAGLAKQGQDTSRVNLASLSRQSPITPQTQLIKTRPMERGPQYASLKNDAEMLPESLQTPTITVEELAPPGQPSPTQARPRWNDMPPPPAAYQAVERPAPTTTVITHDTMTAPPVSSSAYLYVQAGAFSVRGNAENLSRQLSAIGPTVIEPLTTSTGSQLYRVRVGPLSNREDAEYALSRVIASGQKTAHIVGK